MFTHTMDAPFSTLSISEENGKITAVLFGEPRCDPADIRETPVITMAKQQLDLYFNHKLKEFTLPLDLRGTKFQISVWNALREIPYGSCLSYGEIAQAVGNKKACRAVGMANHNNPVSIIVPCHRVIGANGSLTGYGGGLNIKEWLLRHEGFLI